MGRRDAGAPRPTSSLALLALTLLTVLGVLAMHGASLPAVSPHSVHAMSESESESESESMWQSMSSAAPGPAATSADHPHGARHHVLSPCVADAARGSLVASAAAQELSTTAADRARVPARRLETRALPPPDLQQLCISRT